MKFYKQTTPMAICLAMLLGSCAGESVKNTVQEEQTKPLVTVDVATVADVEQISTFTGTIEAQVKNDIAPQSPVRIGRILVEVGDHVSKGQTLVRMDPTNLNQAKVDMENKKVEFMRSDELYKVGGTSKSDWDAKKLAYDVAKSSYNNLLENTTLKSPISGVVSSRNYDNGDMFSSGTPILTVEQIRPVKLIVNVSEVLFTKVKKGMEVDITTDVYGDRLFKGYINIVYPTIDPSTRTFPIEVRLSNADEAIRPGMFARVSLTHDVNERVVIPDRAVLKQTGSGTKYVYRIEDGKAVFTEVTLGRRMGTLYEIIDGLSKGDSVVTTGQTRLTNGCEVDITVEQQARDSVQQQ